MPHICFTLSGYAHLYRSLLRFCRMDAYEAKELTYLLNTANLDSFSIQHPYTKIKETSPFTFHRRMDGNERPYRTEVQLYKALEALDQSISYAAITSEQREAVLRMRCLMGMIELGFYKAFHMDISDHRTVYSLCQSHLIPSAHEPSICLLREWHSMNTA